MNPGTMTTSALRLSALMVVAGTVLGLAGQVVAQSAPVERSERAAAEAREQAKKIVREMRKEIAEGDDDDQQEMRVIVRGDGDEGVWTTAQPRKRVQVQVDPQMKRRVEVQQRSMGPGAHAGGQQEFEVQVLPRGAQGKAQRERIEVRKLGGGEGHGAGHAQVCPECGHAMGDDEGGDKVITLRGMGGMGGQQKMKIQGLEGLKELHNLQGLQGMHIEKLEGLKNLQNLQGLREMHIEGLQGLEGVHGFKMKDGEGRMLVEGHDIGELHDHLMELHGQHEGQFRGKAIVVGPDGKKQVFDLGDDAPKAKAPKAPKPPKAPKAPKPPKAEKQGQGQMFFRTMPQGGPEGGVGGMMVHPGHGGSFGGGNGQGKVIIITPDGKRQEFNFGGDGPRSEGIDLFDGSGHAAHPFEGMQVVPLGGAAGQVVKARTFRGGAV